jgi:Glycosyl hydrolase catalytic core
VLTAATGRAVQSLPSGPGEDALWFLSRPISPMVNPTNSSESATAEAGENMLGAVGARGSAGSQYQGRHSLVLAGRQTAGARRAPSPWAAVLIVVVGRDGRHVRHHSDRLGRLVQQGPKCRFRSTSVSGIWRAQARRHSRCRPGGGTSAVGWASFASVATVVAVLVTTASMTGPTSTGLHQPVGEPRQVAPSPSGAKTPPFLASSLLAVAPSQTNRFSAPPTMVAKPTVSTPHMPPAAASSLRAVVPSRTNLFSATPIVVAKPRASKKGIASSVYLSQDPTKLQELKVSWAYNWSSNVPPSTTTIDDVPMLWGKMSVTPQTIAFLKAGGRSGAYDSLLGFNEPDKAGQADMTPQQAIALWPELESTGLQLGSPAPASPNDGWLDEFMSLAKARGYRVDFIALHFYVDFTSPSSVAWLQTTLQGVYNRYHKPIWITEIGAVDTRPWAEPMAHVPTEARALTFMAEVTAMLDRLAFVDRYAWFADSAWNDPQLRLSSLYDAAGHLTAAGTLYSRTA